VQIFVSFPVNSSRIPHRQGPVSSLLVDTAHFTFFLLPPVRPFRRSCRQLPLPFLRSGPPDSLSEQARTEYVLEQPFSNKCLQTLSWCFGQLFGHMGKRFETASVLFSAELPLQLSKKYLETVSKFARPEPECGI